MNEPKSSRTVKGKIISHSVGKFQDGDKPISQDLLLKLSKRKLVRPSTILRPHSTFTFIYNGATTTITNNSEHILYLRIGD